MARPHPITWLPILDRALEAEIGIAFSIRGIDRQQFLNYLYECRKAAADPKYDALIIFKPGGNYTDELWVCKKEVELGDIA